MTADRHQGVAGVDGAGRSSAVVMEDSLHTCTSLLQDLALSVMDRGR
jgi:hypothetical protein